MARVVVTESALRDETDILNGLAAEGGYRVAEKYKALFDKVYGLLADHPAIGARRPLLGSDVRIWLRPTS